MKTIKLQCKNCESFFERVLKQHKQNKNKETFCGYSCAATYRNKQRGSEWYKIHVPTFQLTSNNRRDEFSPFKYYITKCKERLRQKNENYDIDANYLKELWKRQNGVCPYTNIKMILPETTKHHSNIHSLKKASLDRIDSSKGYLKGNVEFVCLLVNFAKNVSTKEDVMSFFSDAKMASAGGVEPTISPE